MCDDHYSIYHDILWDISSETKMNQGKILLLGPLCTIPPLALHLGPILTKLISGNKKRLHSCCIRKEKKNNNKKLNKSVLFCPSLFLYHAVGRTPFEILSHPHMLCRKINK